MGNKCQTNPRIYSMTSKADIIRDVNSFNSMAKGDEFCGYFKFSISAEILTDISEMKNLNDYSFFRHKRWQRKLLRVMIRVSVIKGVELSHLELNFNDFCYMFDKVYDFFSQTIMDANLRILRNGKSQDSRNSDGNQLVAKAEQRQSQEVDENNGESVCEVCFHQRKELILPCQHSFCENCYDQWTSIKNKKECMMCRMSLVEDAKKDLFFLIDDPGCSRKFFGDQVIEFLVEHNIPLQENK